MDERNEDYDIYGSFACVYDKFMDNVPYKEWGKYLKSLLEEQGISDGLVLWSDLGRVCGVPTPNIDAVITLGGSLLQVDFRKIGLTLDKLGYGDAKTVDDLLQDV